MKCACGSLMKSYEYMCLACFQKEEGKTVAVKTSVKNPPVSKVPEVHRKKSLDRRYSYQDCDLWDEEDHHWKLDAFMDSRWNGGSTPRDRVRKSGLFNFDDKHIGKIKLVSVKDSSNYEFYVDRVDHMLTVTNGTLTINKSSNGYFQD